ncbi:MAG: CDP-alcohol phosphatidyltransferase family protein [Hyphomicrobiaceae bacterium]
MDDLGDQAQLKRPPSGEGAPSGLPVAAALVHLFTASGIVCALGATLAVARGAYVEMFVWLAVAFAIDGIDGTFARAANVKVRLPRFSGEQLDLVIDYVTYVFVPVLALLQAGILAGWWGFVLASLILMSSLYHFSDTASKTDDHCFVGFPAIWNIVAFYLFAFALPAWLASGIILGLVVLTFVPMRWLHPLRVERLRLVTLALMAAWFVAAAAVLWSGFPAGIWSKLVLAGVCLYGVTLTLSMPWATPGAGPGKP